MGAPARPGGRGRLPARSELPVIYVFTHDSIGLGEDGPTHQPVEQLAALRAIPNVMDLRPPRPTPTPVAREAGPSLRSSATLQATAVSVGSAGRRSMTLGMALSAASCSTGS